MAQGIWTPGGGFDRQPQGPVEVDWANPIARGLQIAAVPIGGGYKDLSRNLAWTQVNGPTVDVTNKGRALKTVSGSSQYGYFPCDVKNAPLTILHLSTLDSSSNAAVYSLGTASGTERLVLFYGAVAGQYTISPIPNAGAGDTSFTTGIGDSHTSVLVLPAAATPADFYLNGSKGSTGGNYWAPTGAITRFYLSTRVNSTAGIFSSQRSNLSLVWNRALSDAEIASISANPWQLFRDDTSDILIFDMGGTAGPTVLVANPGALSLSGQANTFLRNLRLAADPGTLSLTGQAATLVVGAVYPLAADPGALSLAGQAATLVVNRITPVLVADPGALSLAGQQVSTLYSRSVVADPGSLGLAGQAATLVTLASNLLVANTGTLSLAGQAAELVVNRVTPVLVAAPGALALTGQQASILATRLLVASPGALSLAGQQATTSASRKLVADPGSLTLLGTAASLGNGLGVSNVYVKVGGAYVAASALRVKQGGVYVGGQAFVKQGGLYLPVMT